MRRTRLYCSVCEKRKSTVIFDSKKNRPVAVCDTQKGGCGTEILLEQDAYGKWHPIPIGDKKC